MAAFLMPYSIGVDSAAKAVLLLGSWPRSSPIPAFQGAELRQRSGVARNAGELRVWKHRYGARATGNGSSSSSGDNNAPPRFGNSATVNDMESYLEDLSLEYESVWDTKPAWCQPWTIILTGVLAITASWLVFHSIALTCVITVLVAAWWFIFLYSYPLGYEQMIAQRRRRIEEGDEDTFGRSTES